PYIAFIENLTIKRKKQATALYFDSVKLYGERSQSSALQSGYPPMAQAKGYLPGAQEEIRRLI
ncbi:MAG TPA: hypothetical protein V6C88_14530, partial [Chroococcidiopsis sp.]